MSPEDTREQLLRDEKQLAGWIADELFLTNHNRRAERLVMQFKEEGTELNLGYSQWTASLVIWAVLRKAREHTEKQASVKELAERTGVEVSGHDPL